MDASETTALIMLRSMVRVHLAPLPGSVKVLVRDRVGRNRGLPVVPLIDGTR
jgi:hypothetical protein